MSDPLSADRLVLPHVDPPQIADASPWVVGPQSYTPPGSPSLNLGDIKQARSLAIDDAVKVVVTYLSGEREGELDIAELVPRLEALKEAKP